MVAYPWQLVSPIDAFVFDCDGTLVMVEGIDELATMRGVEQAVKALTQIAMEERGVDETLYDQRLQLIKPTLSQVQQIGQVYIDKICPDVKQIIAILTALGKDIYIVSAGLSIPVTILGRYLDVATDHVFAIDLYFDNNGNYSDYDRATPLIEKLGKAVIIQEIKKTHRSVLHIGDGLNDYFSHEYSERFVGYGGIYYREKIKNLCDYYIHDISMAALLPLGLTEQEAQCLEGEDKRLYDKGLQHIAAAKVKIAAYA